MFDSVDPPLPAQGDKLLNQNNQLTPLSLFVMLSFIEMYSVCGLEIFYVQFYKMFCMQIQHCDHCTSHLKAIPPPCVLVKKYQHVCSDVS